jgi:glycerol-3-phosphate O-acyltransferase
MTWLRIDDFLFGAIRRLVNPFLRIKLVPESLEDTLGPSQVPICYVLEKASLADLIVLDRVCREQGLPRPRDHMKMRGYVQRKSVCYVRGRRGLFRRKESVAPFSMLGKMTAAVQSDPSLDVRIIPVSIFWGRAPTREQGVFRTLFSEGWAATGPLRKLFVVLLQGRNLLVQVATPIHLRPLVDEGMDQSRCVRKLARVLRVHFRLQRVATIGPDLSHRRTMVNKLLKSNKVRRAIDREMQSARLDRLKATARARRYANEIAANFNTAVVEFGARILQWLWQRLYDGIQVNHFERVREAAQGKEIIYVPCHRSHVDYLLLSYVLYQKGLVVPHIAAGINLNLPILGPFLRGGGAFFLRRSFRGNQLYQAVFQQYLAMNLNKGVPIEYFIEGGRSRTGRPLEPRPGMLSMTVTSYLVNRRRPVLFVPVYFGYERVMEARTFIAELSGKPKKKESIIDLLRFLPTLRQKFGSVFVNFGEPLELESFLDSKSSDWREQEVDEEGRPRWMAPLIAGLGEEILRRVNCAAAVGPVNLIALVLLSTPRQAMLETQLIQQLELYAKLLRDLEYSERVTVTGMAAAEMISYCEKLGVVQRRANKLGDMIVMDDQQAVMGTYYRNNVLHLLAMPSLVASCYLRNERMSSALLTQLVSVVYPYLKTELFMRWEEDQLGERIAHTVDVLGRHGLLVRGRLPNRYSRKGDGKGQVRLGLLARIIDQAIERYYVVIALLVRHGSGAITEKALEEESQLMAQRLSVLFGLDSPEFFDRSLFRNFIRKLKAQGVIHTGADGRLEFGEVVGRLDENARMLLGDEIRLAVRDLTRV